MDGILICLMGMLIPDIILICPMGSSTRAHRGVYIQKITRTCNGGELLLVRVQRKLLKET